MNQEKKAEKPISQEEIQREMERHKLKNPGTKDSTSTSQRFSFSQIPKKVLHTINTTESSIALARLFYFAMSDSSISLLERSCLFTVFLLGQFIGPYINFDKDQSPDKSKPWDIFADFLHTLNFLFSFTSSLILFAYASDDEAGPAIGLICSFIAALIGLVNGPNIELLGRNTPTK